MSENGNGPVPKALPPWDTGNPLMADGPSNLSVTPVQTPSSKLMLTVRTSSCTVTVLLDKPTAQDWASTINAGCANMSGIILPGQ